MDTPSSPDEPQIVDFLPSRDEMDSIREKVFSYPNTTACFIGEKVVDGKSTGRLAIVCGVSKKIDRKKLKRGEAIPKSLGKTKTPFPFSGISTDVQIIKPARFAAAIPGPADATRDATVGVAILHPEFGRVITTAAHSLVPKRWMGVRSFKRSRDRIPVVLENVFPRGRYSGKVVKIVRTERADYALITPDAPLRPQNLFRDSLQLNMPHDPTLENRGHPYWLLTPASPPSNRRTKLLSVDASFEFNVGIRMDGMLLTQRISKSGDSGACLVDRFRRPAGLVIGAERGISVFMPLQRVLQYEDAGFI